ncbi:hypothetical protein [Ottowia sp. VDI28]|uniref:hypothetical protein n=1 Tax=Ottowia sp. VDI28 TaxID=3133968 RepID=UPI003C2B092F
MQQQKISPAAIGSFVCWLIISMSLMALCIFGPSRLWPQATGIQLGSGLPAQLLEDPDGRLTAAEVVALPDADFTPFGVP